jgi:hypothetical protein
LSITQDGWFNDTLIKALSNTIALDLSNTTPGTFKAALFQETLTPNFSQTNPAYGSSPFNADEASGPGYTAGGVNLTVTSFAELAGSANKIGWKMSAIGWTSATFAARGLLIYAPGLSNRAVLLRDFTQTYSSQDGDYDVTFHTDGAWRSVWRNAA